MKDLTSTLQDKDLAKDQWREFVSTRLIRSAESTRLAADTTLDSIVEAASRIAACFQRSGKVLLCGNGGSAADAQHIAAEFVNRLSGEFERPGLPAIALTTDTSFLTSYANDYGYDGVFERQVETLGQRGDVLVGISTSGNSRNVIRAVTAGHRLGIQTIGLSGDGGELRNSVDCAVVVPSQNTQHIQETLLTIEHAICELVEHAMFARPE